MDGIRAIKVNNVINKNLIFKFDGHPISTETIVSALLLLIAIMAGTDYFFFYLCLILIFIIIVILNIQSVYFITFDNDHIVIKNKFRKHIICYRNGIEITINKEVNLTKRLYRRLAKENRYKYSLVIKDGSEHYVLATSANDSIALEVEKFIGNFSFEESLEKKPYIRFDRKFCT